MAEARATAERVEALGHRTILAPMMEVSRVVARLPAASSVQAILATSAHATRILPRGLHAVRLLAVGEATAWAAREAGFTNVVSGPGDAAGLAQLASRTLNPRADALLLAARRGEGVSLATDLRGRGFRVLRRIVYAAHFARSLPATVVDGLETRRIGAMLFFSASAATSFARIVTAGGIAARLGPVTALVISEAVAGPLRALPFRAIRIAARPDQPALLDLLEMGEAQGARGQNP